MNQDFQLKLQALMDGELPEREARDTEAMLAANPEAQALLAELRNTHGALAGFEAGIKLPESPEFHWSKIQRQIERERGAATPERSAEVARIPFWRRFLAPAGALAVVVIAGLLAVKQFTPADTTSASVETYLADSGAVTYRDKAEGLTVVWLSYPAEGENQIADPEAPPTLP